MRSIRRSLTAYLLFLLAVTLALVWVAIDRVTAQALAERQAAGEDVIHSRYEERCREERARVDDSLLDQAKLLGNIMQREYANRYGIEWTKYRAAVGMLQVGFASTPWSGGALAESAWTASGNHWMRDRPNPLQPALFRLYFSNLPIPDDFVAHFDEPRAQDYFQINTPAGREWRSGSLGGRKLPFDAKEIDGKSADQSRTGEGLNAIDWTIGTAAIGAESETVRRVVYKMPHFTANPAFGAFRPPSRGSGGFGGFTTPGDRKDDRPAQPGTGPAGGPPRSLLGTWAALTTAGLPWPPPQPPPAPTFESYPRLYIQCARPQAALDATFSRFAAERDEALAALPVAVDATRRELRYKLTGVALAAFLALTLGAPLLVGRGLRPLGKLSVAVSHVSEKDFRLPHDGTDLAVELVPIHARLTQTLDLLQRAFSREKQAVADISHELRTPIAALLATIDVALRKPRTSDQYRTALEECRLISRQLGQLVERIMTLASLDAGGDCTTVARTDAGELASGCVAVIRPLAAANDVAIELRGDDPLDLDTDAAKLREVLMNLLHNAVEYNKPGGRIELRATRAAGGVVFEVRDTGIGMTPAVKDKIFERFYRSDPSRHATGVHAGLGLAIVKEYVNRLNGTITVESEPGVGSTFRVTLPAPAASPAGPNPADEPLTAGV